MPNWTDNRLEITGNEKHVLEFKNWIKNECNGDFKINNWLPTPEELTKYPSPNNDEEKVKEFEAKYGHGDWYAWCVANWGTKWDLVLQDDDFLENFDKHKGFCFDTAWSPPIKAIESLSLKFPNLKFKIHFIDEAWMFWGEAEIQNGETEEISYEWDDVAEHGHEGAYRMLVDEFQSGNEDYVKERIEDYKSNLEE